MNPKWPRLWNSSEKALERSSYGECTGENCSYDMCEEGVFVLGVDGCEDGDIGKQCPRVGHDLMMILNERVGGHRM